MQRFCAYPPYPIGSLDFGPDSPRTVPTSRDRIHRRSSSVFAETNCQIAVSGRPTWRAFASLSPRPVSDDPIESLGEGRRLILEPQENARGSWYGHEAGREIEREASGNFRAYRIVFLRQHVENNELTRLPLLRPRQNRVRLRQARSPAGQPHSQTAARVEGLRRPIAHAEREHVINLAGHRLVRLHQHLLKRRLQVHAQRICGVRDPEDREFGGCALRVEAHRDLRLAPRRRVMQGDADELPWQLTDYAWGFPLLGRGSRQAPHACNNVDPPAGRRKRAQQTLGFQSLEVKPCVSYLALAHRWCLAVV